MLNIEENLIQCGLTKNESRVYYALLRLGSASAVDITRESKVHRVNVYDVLERLREKGLISSIMVSNKKVYEAADPSQISKLIEQKEEILNSIMPSLKLEYGNKNVKQKVYHFTGPEGVLQAYYMMLDQNSMVYALGGSGLNRKILKHRHAMFKKEAAKRNIGGKGIYYEFTRKHNLHDDEKTPVEVRYIPDEFKTLSMVDICGDLVVNLIPVEDDFQAIVIENRILADSFRCFFNFMWQFAKP